MNHKPILLAAAAIFAMTACKGPEPIRTVEKTYEITDLKRPKHFLVTVRDVETGQVNENLYVSKHCFEWGRLKVGSLWIFKETTYRWSDGSTYTEIDASDLCNRLSKGDVGKEKQ